MNLVCQCQFQIPLPKWRDEQHLTFRRNSATRLRLQVPVHEDFATSYDHLIKACRNAKKLSDVKRVHAEVVRVGLDYAQDTFLGSHLVQMYLKLGSLKDARETFDRMHANNVITWTEMIGAYVRLGDHKETLQLFQKMQLDGVAPDRAIFTMVLGAFASPEVLRVGEMIHALVRESGLEMDVFVATALVNMYSKCRSLGIARWVFDRMQEKNVVSWTTMLAAYAEHGYSKEAFIVFHEMQLEGVMPNRFTYVAVLDVCANLSALKEGRLIHARVMDSGFDYNVVMGTAIVNMYGKCGKLEEARRAFDKILQADLVAWNAMVAAYAQNGYRLEALELFQLMQLEGTIPSWITFVSILSVCRHAGSVDVGSEYYVSMLRDFHIEPMVEHYGCMIDLLGRAGRLNDAEEFVKSSVPIYSDAVIWMSLLDACRVQGDVQRGREVARRVLELDSNNFTAGEYAAFDQRLRPRTLSMVRRGGRCGP